jgi:hypothetical protein
LSETPGESAETVVADLEADVCDAPVSIQEQPLCLIQPHRRDELGRRKTGDLMKHAIEMERAEIGDSRHIPQRDGLTQPLTRIRDHAFDRSPVGHNGVCPPRGTWDFLKRFVY